MNTGLSMSGAAELCAPPVGTFLSALIVAEAQLDAETDLLFNGVDPTGRLAAVKRQLTRLGYRPAIPADFPDVAWIYVSTN